MFDLFIDVFCTKLLKFSIRIYLIGPVVFDMQNLRSVMEVLVGMSEIINYVNFTTSIKRVLIRIVWLRVPLFAL